MSKIRIALIGAGVIGNRHLAAMADVSDVALVGIADPFPAARAVSDSHGVPLFSDAATLLDETNPDGVIVATPTEHHFQPTMQSLESGAHVLVEKPIMATMEESESVITKSRDTGRHVLVGHHRRYYGLVDQAREIVQSGRIGQLIAVSGQWNMRKHADYYDPDWRKKWQAGPVLTNLIHEMDLLRYVAGDVVSISAQTSNAVMGFEKEDAAALVIQFRNGALGAFVLSDQSHSPWGWEQATGENAAFPRSAQNAIRFMGTEGSLEFPNLKVWTSRGTSEWRNPLAAQDLSGPLEDAFSNQIVHFAKVIRGDEQPRISARDAADTLRATLAVYEAAKSGRRVTL